MLVSSGEEDEASEDEAKEEGSENEEDQGGQVVADESASGSDSEASEQEDAARKVAVTKRKKKQVSSKETPAKKVKKTPTPPVKKPILDEKKHPKQEAEKEGEDKKSGKKEPQMFNESNIDLDLYDNDPTKLKTKKIRVSQNLILTCKTMKMLVGNENHEWAAIVLEKRVKDNKVFPFNFSLQDAPKVIEALKAIILENEKFFKVQSI